MRHHLTRLGLVGRLAFTVTGDDTPRHKPAPDLYLLALRRVGAEAAACLAVEDSPPGVRAAKAAGLRCVAVAGSGAAARGTLGADLVLARLDLLELHGAPARTTAGAKPAGQEAPTRERDELL
ncbi:hypothetical protein SSPO_000390 [Streptomyces antimycoticus]|uniref:Haloacid dehalogenase n=1 Tax=Streptomyces antimycoticus TaxID=68175 RepID=A0A499UJC6_9ACTN|nr:hypothetical protein SSPO_000390 [Streptomyces antimycoticus]